MLKLIMGLSGSGKTKTLLSLVHQAAETTPGNVICIEKDKDLTYDIPYQVRLIHAGEYGICSNALLTGFILGLHAGNYDISHIFVENFYKMLDDRSNEAVEKMLDTLSAFAEKEGISLTLVASADPSAVSEGVRKYF